ncbi:hypothetical protein JCM6882_000413 [Rhodosporidiobolus microsporus]
MDPPTDALEALALSGPSPASFSSLPYELVALIAPHLDPCPLRAQHEAPSVTRQRRDAGRALALVSRNARSVGTELVWRRVVAGFHRNAELLRRIVEEKWMAEYVKQLHVVCSPKNAETAFEFAPPDVLPLFTALDELLLAATPPVLEHFLSPVLSSSTLAHLARLEIVSSFGASPTFPSFILALIPSFPNLSHLTLDLRLHPDTGTISPPPPSPALTRLRHLSLTIEDAPPPLFPTLTSFLSSLSCLISSHTLHSFALYSPYAPSTLLTSLALSAPSLTTLTVSLSIGPLIARLPSLLDLLPSFARLKTLRILVQPHAAAPLIFPASNPLRTRLFEALEAIPALEVVELDFDLMDPLPGSTGSAESDTWAFLTSRLKGDSKLRMWATLEWEEALALRRQVLFERMTGTQGDHWASAGGGGEVRFELFSFSGCSRSSSCAFVQDEEDD